MGLDFASVGFGRLDLVVASVESVSLGWWQRHWQNGAESNDGGDELSMNTLDELSDVFIRLAI